MHVGGDARAVFELRSDFLGALGQGFGRNARASFELRGCASRYVRRCLRSRRGCGVRAPRPLSRCARRGLGGATGAVFELGGDLAADRSAKTSVASRVRFSSSAVVLLGTIGEKSLSQSWCGLRSPSSSCRRGRRGSRPRAWRGPRSSMRPARRVSIRSCDALLVLVSTSCGNLMRSARRADRRRRGRAFRAPGSRPRCGRPAIPRTGRCGCRACRRSPRARLPSVESISALLAESCSVSAVPRELMVLVTCSMRPSRAATTSLPPSARFLAISRTRCAERVVERLGAAVERLLEAHQPQVERVGDFAGLAADALVEIVDAGAHRVGDRLGAVAEPLDQFGAMHLHGAVEFAEMAGDQIAERGGIVGDAFGEGGAALREHFLERDQARAQHFLQRVAVGADGGGDGVGGAAERLHHLSVRAEDGFGDGGAGLFELRDDVAATQAEIEQQRIAGRLQRRIDLLAAHRDRFGGLAPRPAADRR